MSKDTQALDRADAEARAARERLTGSVTEAKARLAPSALRREATNRSMDYALDRISDGKAYAAGHPFQIVGVAALLGAVVARRPIWALLRPSLVEGFRQLKQWREEK